MIDPRGKYGEEIKRNYKDTNFICTVEPYEEDKYVRVTYYDKILRKCTTGVLEISNLIPFAPRTLNDRVKTLDKK